MLAQGPLGQHLQLPSLHVSFELAVPGRGVELRELAVEFRPLLGGKPSQKLTLTPNRNDVGGVLSTGFL